MAGNSERQRRQAREKHRRQQELRAARQRQIRKRWLTGMVISGLIIIAISGYLRWISLQ